MHLHNHTAATANFLSINKQSSIRNNHKGRSATSYDSVHSLTVHNNHYTLLYPDLVQELFNFALNKSNIHTNISHSLGGLSNGIDKSSSLDTSLHPRDILFFLQIVSLYQLELRKGNTSITYPSLKLAKLLGVDASCDNTHHLTANTHNSVNSLTDANRRATILRMTSKLESLGLLKVFRRKRSNGMDMANKLIPVLPDRLYEKIKDSPANLKVSDSSKLDHESNLEHILRTKLFVPIELDFLKNLFKDNMPAKYKLFFLNCIMSAYRNFRKNNSSSLSFSATSRELIKQTNISKRSLFNIFRYIKQQGDNFFLKVEHKYTKSDDIDSNRYDKSIFVISIDPLVFPISHIQQFQKEDNIDYEVLPDTYKWFETGVQKNSLAVQKKQPLIIKISNKDIDANIDKNLDEKKETLDTLEKNNQIKPQTFLKTSNSQHLESERCSLSSKFLKNIVKDFIDSLPSPSNATCTNASKAMKENLSGVNKTNIPNNFNVDILKKTTSQSQAINDRKNKDFRHFYPLSEKDISLLNSRSNREFSHNFVNQLLLKLYIKYPKNRFTFLSYMVQILANEKHQGPLVNHTSFRFSCNIGTEEKNLLEQEKYLNQIEDSLDLSKEMQLKKKIAGRFSTEVAYAILTKVKFKTNHDDIFITALIPNNLAVILSERQKEALGEQLEEVYGINGCYVQELEEDAIQPPKSRKFDIASDNKSTENSAPSNKSSTESEEVLENTAWHQIRKTLREELGDHIDEAWFAKTVATECKDTKILTLTMPTRFMSDWVRNNYSHVIRRVAGSVGVKMVEIAMINNLDRAMKVVNSTTFKRNI